MDRRRFIKSVLVAAVATVLPLPALRHSGPFWVATDGSDGNSGDHKHPFATIDRALRQCERGDTIVVMSGEYLIEPVCVSS